MSGLGHLSSQQDFEQFRANKSFDTNLLKIRVHFPLRNQNAPRFGFIIPKKVLPKVADRNKLKRRIKTVLLKFAPQLKAVDILFFPRANLLKVKFSQVERDIELLFTKGRLWKS